MARARISRPERATGIEVSWIGDGTSHLNKGCKDQKMLRKDRLEKQNLPFFINSHQKLTLQTHIFEAGTFCVSDIGCFNSVILNFSWKWHVIIVTTYKNKIYFTFAGMLSFCFQAWSSPPAGLVFLGDEDAIFISFLKNSFFVVSQKWKIYFWNKLKLFNLIFILPRNCLIGFK